MAVNKPTIESLYQKLETFSGTLSREERTAFKSMLEGNLSEETLQQVTGGQGIARASFASHSACW